MKVLLELLEELLDDVLEEEMKEEMLNKRKRRGLRRRSPASLSMQDTSENGEESTLRIISSTNTPRNRRTVHTAHNRRARAVES